MSRFPRRASRGDGLERRGNTHTTRRRQGFGTLALGVAYPAGRPSEDESVALVRLAAARGCTLFDAADCYCAGPGDEGYAERILGRALADAPPVVISTKGGCKRQGDGTKPASV